MTPGLHPGYQQFKSAPTHIDQTEEEFLTMAGDLLHLIRDAERKAEKILEDARHEAQKIIENARSEAKEILAHASSEKKTKQIDEHSNSRKNIQTKIQELEEEFNTRRSEYEKLASRNKSKGVEFVAESILKG